MNLSKLVHLLVTATERAGRWACRDYWQLQVVRIVWRFYVVVTVLVALVVVVQFFIGA